MFIPKWPGMVMMILWTPCLWNWPLAQQKMTGFYGRSTLYRVYESHWFPWIRSAIEPLISGGWWFPKSSIFHPLVWEMIPIWRAYSSNGWGKNHQRVTWTEVFQGFGGFFLNNWSLAGWKQNAHFWVGLVVSMGMAGWSFAQTVGVHTHRSTNEASQLGTPRATYPPPRDSQLKKPALWRETNGS